MSSKVTTVSDWLVDAKALQPGDQLNIYLWDHKGPPPSFQDMRAALWAQYGEDTPIRIWKHGQRISIFIHSDPESRARFDARSAPSVIRARDGSRKEYVAGFERDLPAGTTGKGKP